LVKEHDYKFMDAVLLARNFRKYFLQTFELKHSPTDKNDQKYCLLYRNIVDFHCF